MLNEPIAHHHQIPIYLKQFSQGDRWLQWQRHQIKYGVRVASLSEGLAIANKTIDAVLELETTRSQSCPTT
ncbi:MAG TPA: hypothetical protein V6C57_21055 [Coleofasciculaceae cyanobacterium]